jgi:hypothetical protein
VIFVYMYRVHVACAMCHLHVACGMCMRVPCAQVACAMCARVASGAMCVCGMCHVRAWSIAEQTRSMSMSFSLLNPCFLHSRRVPRVFKRRKHKRDIVKKTLFFKKILMSGVKFVGIRERKKKHF